MNKKILIGHSGLIGHTLKKKIVFDYEYNSENIDRYTPENGCDLYLSCLPSSKWLINKNTRKDIENIISIVNIIADFNYNNVYLISTIDVYNKTPLESNEDVEPIFTEFSYGSNRYLFEKMIKQHVNYQNLKIFRLPALFSEDIKKNILYDLIYNNNVHLINKNSYYQWYNLNDLVDDIDFYSKKYPNELIFNLYNEPLNSEEIINLFPQHINNVIHSENKILYNYKTKFSTNGYIKSKDEILSEIKQLINELINK